MSKQSVIDDLCKCIEKVNERTEKLAKRITICEGDTWSNRLDFHSHIVCGSRTGHRMSVIAEFPEGYTFKCLNCGMQYAAYKNKGFTDYEQKIIDNLNEKLCQLKQKK